METKEIELCKYFKAKSEFKKILKIIKSKYESLGKFSGKIDKNSLKKSERDVISSITGKNYEIGSRYIQISEIIESLEYTNFAGVDFKESLEIYFDEELIHKKEEKENYEEHKERFFNDLCKWYENTPGGDFLAETYDSGKGYLLLIKEYNRYYNENSLSNFEIVLEKIVRALNKLPINDNRYQLLPMFASDIANDPHFFDMKNFAGKLFLYGLATVFDKNYPNNSEKKAELYLEGGIIIDDISNSVTLCGLTAEIDGRIYEGWQGYYKEKEYFITPMSGITKLDKIIAEYNNLIVVENPAVFVEIFNYFKNKKNIVLPMICGYGNIRLSALFLMDLAVKSGLNLLYSGDLDPEGLLIADKLKMRYADKIQLIGYSEKNYFDNISDEKINDRSMKKLKKIKSIELKNMVELLQKNGCKSFQESFVEDLIEIIGGKNG